MAIPTDPEHQNIINEVQIILDEVFGPEVCSEAEYQKQVSAFYNLGEYDHPIEPEENLFQGYPNPTEQPCIEIVEKPEQLPIEKMLPKLFELFGTAKKIIKGAVEESEDYFESIATSQNAAVLTDEVCKFINLFDPEELSKVGFCIAEIKNIQNFLEFLKTAPVVVIGNTNPNTLEYICEAFNSGENINFNGKAINAKNAVLFMSEEDEGCVEIYRCIFDDKGIVIGREFMEIILFPGEYDDEIQSIKYSKAVSKTAKKGKVLVTQTTQFYLHNDMEVVTPLSTHYSSAENNTKTSGNIVFKFNPSLGEYEINDNQDEDIEY